MSAAPHVSNHQRMLVVDHSLPGAPLREVSDEELAERARLDHDRFDEVWDGVAHLNPSGGADHHSIEFELGLVLYPLVQPLGLRIATELSVMDASQPLQNYRNPDLVVYDPAQLDLQWATRGIALAVDVRSPHDASYEKLPFFAARGIPEVLIVHPRQRTVELFLLQPNATYRADEPDPHDGSIALRFVPVGFTTIPPLLPNGSPVLRATTPTGHLDI